MATLTGSTKRSDWERRWGHSLPRDWEGGRIQVDGDATFQQEAIRWARWISTVVIGAVAAVMLIKWIVR